MEVKAIVEAYSQKSAIKPVIAAKKKEQMYLQSLVLPVQITQQKHVSGIQELKTQQQCYPNLKLKQNQRDDGREFKEKSNDPHERLASVEGYTVARKLKYWNECPVAGDYHEDPIAVTRLLQSTSVSELNSRTRTQDFASSVQFRLSLRNEDVSGFTRPPRK